jgi:hypothetical protein
MTRSTLTTKQNKAKCLNYRNGRRCGRLGRYLVSGVNPLTGQPFSYPACAECKTALVETGAELKGYSPKGYTVTVSTFGPVSRTYTAIAPTCAKCERSTELAGKDAYCYPCGVEVEDCRRLEMLYHAADNAGEDRQGW